MKDVPAPAVEQRVTRRLDPVPESARTARELVLQALADAARSDLEDTAAVLVSELVTNAIVHAGTVIELQVLVDRNGLRVAVQDLSDAVPTQRHYGRSSTTGRGLALVELLADSHGMFHEPHGGKTVWFELGAPAGAPPHADSQSSVGRPGSSHPSSVIPVSLLALPVALALAWQQHADALLREYTLARWDDDRGYDVLVDDLVAHEAFAVVAAAFEPLAIQTERAPYANVTLQVPADHLSHFDALDEVLDHVVGLAKQGLTLAPPLQPEIRSFRRWLVRQVIGQCSGGAAAPWPGLASDPEITPGPVVEWDATDVTTAVGAVVAADDLNRIIAASPTALDLLGWDEDLLGQRIVSVIPLRYREAHIAAFTLNQLTGEKRILGREILISALRRDGSEVDVHLLVEREVAVDGRTVYTANMRPA